MFDSHLGLGEPRAWGGHGRGGVASASQAIEELVYSAGEIQPVWWNSIGRLNSAESRQIQLEGFMYL